MEIREEYVVLFKAITEATKELQELAKRSEKCWEFLIEAQKKAEEIYISIKESGIIGFRCDSKI